MTGIFLPLVVFCDYEPSFCCKESATTRNDLRPIDILSGAFITWKTDTRFCSLTRLLRKLRRANLYLFIERELNWDLKASSTFSDKNRNSATEYYVSLLWFNQIVRQNGTDADVLYPSTFSGLCAITHIRFLLIILILQYHSQLTITMEHAWTWPDW